MFQLENLLRNEFFPAELPECFSTNDLADNASEAISATKEFNRSCSVPIKFSGYKSESSRRKFSIPNPYHYIKAANVIVENSEHIFNVLRKSVYSLTAPVYKLPDFTEPYAKKVVTVADTKKMIESQYNDNRYEIRLDISSFFDSIYTHSIPWAIHGIAQAKRMRNDDSLLGNILDQHMRAMNYNQTNGILVGNAVSRIISEILLCTVDAQIRQKFPDISCCRYVDDYYIYTKDSTQIQEIISHVRTYLAQYELSFNENKIQINESPFLYGQPWVEEVKQYIHLPPEVFLSKLIMEFNTHKDIKIIKYGLKVLSCYKYTPKNWGAMQSRFLNLWVRFPSLANRIYPILMVNQEFLKKSTLKQAIYSVIDEAILLHRDQELIWAIWFIKVFDIHISQTYVVNVLSSKNDIAKIIILDIISKRNLSTSKRIKQELIRLRDDLISLDSDNGKNDALMWSQHWLLAYEADLNKWLTIDGVPFQIARKNQFFQKLIKNKVKFYDPDFSYEQPKCREMGHEYATRAELYSVVSKLKKLIATHTGNNNKHTSDAFNDKEKQLYEKLVDILENDRTVY